MIFLIKSLYARLVLICAGASLISVFALGGYVAFEQSKLATQAAYQHSHDISVGLSNALIDDFVSDNYSGIDLTVAEFSTYPNLLRVNVAKNDGTLIVSTFRDEKTGGVKTLHGGHVSLPQSTSSVSTLVDNRIITWVPIIAGNQVGWVSSDLSINEITNTQRRILIVTSLIGLISLILSVFLGTLALRRTIHEIRSAARFATELPKSHEKNLELSAQSAEMQELALALNLAARELRDQDKELRKLTRDFIALLENTGDYIYFKDHESRIRFCSQTLAIRMGYDSWHDMIGQYDREIFPEEAALVDTEEELSIFSNGHPIVNRIDPYIDSKGNHGWVSTSKWPVFSEEGNRVIGTFGISRDVSNQIEAEEKMQESHLLAERAAQIRGQFLANMSHEIRTPMNGIIGLSQLALNKELNPEIRDYLEKIDSSAQSLLGILNDILDFSKLEAGRVTIEKIQFDLYQMIDNLKNLFEAHAKAKLIEFRIGLTEDIPHHLVGDALRIQQILCNLVGNAIKFTSQGHVALYVKTKRLEHTNAILSFEVSDTGIGISETERSKLFQPFSQADGSITRKFGGSGLGLVISQQLLSLMDSQFNLDSQPGKGSTFQFDLILGTVPDEKTKEIRHYHKTQAGELEKTLQESGNLRQGGRILVAEDNVINQQIVREFLNLSGMVVTIANNGQEVLSLLRENEFDAILMDVHMPVMGGLETTKRIRQNSQYADLPIIAFTAGVTENEHQTVIESGMNDFVTKPVNPGALIGTLTKWIRDEISTDSLP